MPVKTPQQELDPGYLGGHFPESLLEIAFKSSPIEMFRRQSAVNRGASNH